MIDDDGYMHKSMKSLELGQDVSDSPLLTPGDGRLSDVGSLAPHCIPGLHPPRSRRPFGGDDNQKQLHTPLSVPSGRGGLITHGRKPLTASGPSLNSCSWWPDRPWF